MTVDRVTELRRMRKRAVRTAIATGGTVPWDLRQLIEDGHSIATIRKVIRPVDERGGRSKARVAQIVNEGKCLADHFGHDFCPVHDGEGDRR